MKLKGMIFDMDGTLMDSLPVCFAGFRKTLMKHIGREYSDKEIEALFGPNEEGIFKSLSPDTWRECLKTYLDEYENAHTEYANPFDGIEKALKLLKGRNMKLGIVSGKGAGSMAISLRFSGLGDFFEIVETGSEHGARKPAQIKKVLEIWGLKADEVAYIGDAPYDMKAAKEADTVFIGAAWADTSGFRGSIDEKPDVCFCSVEEFCYWIEDNIEKLH